MRAERWKQAKEILAQAFDKKPNERTNFILSACNGDVELIAELQSYLVFYEDDDSFLEEPVIKLVKEKISQEHKFRQANNGEINMRSKVILTVTKGPIKGNNYTFEEHDTFIFGRSPECHAQLSQKDEKVSRHHFLLEVNPPDARIRDLGSLNGTYVNEKKYDGRSEGETPEEAARRKFPEVDLKNGDLIRVGETEFNFQVEKPAICCECNSPIPKGFEELCKWDDNSFICPKCRKIISQSGISNKKPKRIHCSQCKRDVSNEVGNRSVGDYICQTCFATVKANPAAILHTILDKEKQNPSPTVRNEAKGDMAEYEIIKDEDGNNRELGKGGMGVVYLARQKRDGTMVALKVMLAQVAVDEMSRQMFQREIKITSELSHPNIVTLFDYGSTGSAFYFAMEACNGGGVDGLLKEHGGKLPLKMASTIILQALDGLTYAHEKGFVHRDLKPPNILLSSKTNGIAKISDFGLAKSFQKAGLSGVTVTGAKAGTPFFMPKEQVTNFKHCKPVSDVWSMAATFYYMLTSQAPRNFLKGKDAFQIILQQSSIPIRERDSNIPPRIAEVVDRALLDNTKERYQTAVEFRDALVKSL